MDECVKSRHVKGNIGRLQNGERFVIYRIALYADGFQQNKASRQSKSVGGVYILPLGLPTSDRISLQSARPLCITPHGMSINSALGIILEDLRKSATEGIDGIDPSGRRVRIFIDTVAFFGDFPQVAAFTDVLGHSANALCSHCYMRRRKNQNVPETNFSVEIHAGRPGYCRFNARRYAIRESRPDSRILRALGMKYDERQRSESLPAISYSKLLSSSEACFQRSDGTPVLPLHFEHAANVPVFPNHLLSSLVSYVMKACFYSLLNNDKRAEVEMRIVTAAHSNGLDVKGNIINWERTKKATKFKGVCKNSMSAWFSLLVIAAPIFQEIHERSKLKVFLLPKRLQSLVARTYKWPKALVEGSDAVNDDFVNYKHQLKYQEDVLRLATDFLNSCKDVFAENKLVGAIVDKPITHRLLELVSSTIQMYGHARICSEMVLEHTHQQFKKWLANSTGTDAHLTAMEKALGRDWLWRLSALYMTITNGTPDSVGRAEMGLRRLVLGEEGVAADLSTHAGEQVKSQLRESLLHVMRPPVTGMLKESIQDNFGVTEDNGFTWRGTWTMKDNISRDDDVWCTGIVSLRTPMDISPSDLRHCHKARFLRERADGSTRSYPHNVIQSGDAVSAVVVSSSGNVTSARKVQITLKGDGDIRYYAVHHIIRNTVTTDVWAVVKELEQEKDKERTYSCRHSSFLFLLLDDTCRRVAVVHACTTDCVRRKGWAIPVHTASLCDGGSYYVVDRRSGYPPFLG